LTRLPLTLKEVRRQIAVGDAVQNDGVDGNQDPEVMRMKSLESLNKFHCDVLASHGFDANSLRKTAPRRYKPIAVAAPHSMERVVAIKNAKTAGQLFFATGGSHINSDEFFKARELKRRDEEIAKMEDAKKKRGEYCQKQRAAVMLIRNKGELTQETAKQFTIPEVKMLLHWKKVKAEGSKKRDLVDAYIEAPKPKIQKVWCRSEEQALTDLKNQNVDLKDTALGLAASQMARAVSLNLNQLDKDAIQSLKEALEGLGDNVI
jgi:hypothetical protein